MMPVRVPGNPQILFHTHIASGTQDEVGPCLLVFRGGKMLIRGNGALLVRYVLAYVLANMRTKVFRMP